MKFTCCALILSLCCFAQILYGGNPKPQNYQNFTVSIQPSFGNIPLNLSTSRYITSSGDTVLIDAFRFYLSNFEFKYEDGTTYKPQNSYNLVDAEIESSLMINFTKIPQGNIVAIRFKIGVDSIKSVSGVHGGDLDPTHGMYWSWNSGYINAKLEGRSKSCATHRNAFEFHIGGYAYPNNSLREVELILTSGRKEVLLNADASCWFHGIDLTKETGIMIPGAKAQKIADKYQKMFSIVQEHEN